MRTSTDGRAAYEKGAWAQAYESFCEADARSPLDPDDLDRLATAAYLIGEDAASLAARERAHAGFLERGEKVHAASSAFWLGFSMIDNPAQRAQAGGWLARARRLIAEVGQPCVEEGWLLCASAIHHAGAGDVESAHAAFAQAAEIGERFRNRDLIALARHGQGRTLLRLNRMQEGLALVDEVMVAVVGGEVMAPVAGVVYCSVISACHDLFDLRRASEWTNALQRWCASQPDLVPFRGYCLVRRSELMQLQGAWQDALGEAQRACERLAAPPGQSATGAAHYQLAELHRLRGDFARAEDAYRLASQAGRRPYPGLALLRLAQEQSEAAYAAIRHGLQEVREPRPRVHLLRACVDIALSTENIRAAREAAEELVQITRQFNAPFLKAAAAQASGAVALAEGQIEAALDSLRLAWTTWQELDTPYDAARVRVLIGLAYRGLGDQEGAQLEFDAAHEIFNKLGAAPDAARVTALSAQGAPDARGGLTGREVEVLRLIATGATNRVIATQLVISEKTVARHVSNIFTKLDLSSRAAATAYAYKHKLL